MTDILILVIINILAWVPLIVSENDSYGLTKTITGIFGISVTVTIWVVYLITILL